MHGGAPQVSFRYPRARLLLFAREPRAGEVKTRLQGELGAAGCLALYRRLLAHSLAVLNEADLAPWRLWVSGDPAHPDFSRACAPRDILRQSGDDLGARMANALASELRQDGVDVAVLLGSDCPVLTGTYLEQALSALETGADLVLGPVEDGGYILIGLRRPQPALFEAIDWGSERVLEQTLIRANALGLVSRVLEPLWDVDTANDLRRLENLGGEWTAPI